MFRAFAAKFVHENNWLDVLPRTRLCDELKLKHRTGNEFAHPNLVNKKRLGEILPSLWESIAASQQKQQSSPAVKPFLKMRERLNWPPIGEPSGVVWHPRRRGRSGSSLVMLLLSGVWRRPHRPGATATCRSLCAWLRLRHSSCRKQSQLVVVCFSRAWILVSFL